MLSDDLEESDGEGGRREAQAGGDIYIYTCIYIYIYILIADSLHCTAETNTALQNKYILMKSLILRDSDALWIKAQTS